ncbi:MAG: RidA family protein [Pseudomonadota bacterium]
MEIERKLQTLDLTLPAALEPPAGTKLPFPWVRIDGDRLFVSGHAPLAADGRLATPRGKVGRDLNLEQGYEAARLTALAILASIQREIGDLDQIAAWLRAFGMVNVADGFNQMPSVINGFSDLIIELYGPDRGAHARSAVGMAALPFDIPVEIEAEVRLK